MTDSHLKRLAAYVLANPNTAGFLAEVDALKADIPAGDALEDAIVDLAVQTIAAGHGTRESD